MVNEVKMGVCEVEISKVIKGTSELMRGLVRLLRGLVR